MLSQAIWEGERYSNMNYLNKVTFIAQIDCILISIKRERYIYIYTYQYDVWQATFKNQIVLERYINMMY